MSTRRVAIVPPRYGDDVVGGAESLLREAARGLAERGWDVDVLTTCARDHYTWANHYRPGVTQDGLVNVHRFEVVKDTSGADRARIEAELAAGLHPGVRDQELWMNDGLRVPGLFDHLLDHWEDYRVVVVAPYLFWTTFAGSQVAPERTLLIPCMHDEPYAFLELFEPMFTGVAGVWFLTDPEADLASGIVTGPRTEVIGSGIDIPETYDPEGFRARHGIARPFVLAGGRREGAKGWDKMMAAYAESVRGGVELDLVTFGVGEVGAPDDIAAHVIDLGYLSDGDLSDAFAAAQAYIQPSSMESFSRTVMEAWAAGTMVLATAGSSVVAWHCERSGAGLVYRDDFEFDQCLRFVADEPQAARALAAPGRAYVEENYTWPRVLDRMEALLEEWF